MGLGTSSRPDASDRTPLLGGGAKGSPTLRHRIMNSRYVPVIYVDTGAPKW